MDIDRYVEPFRATLKASANVETALSQIRQMGASQIQSVFAVKTAKGLSITEADRVVLNSVTWRDHYDATVDLRNQIADFFDSSPQGL